MNAKTILAHIVIKNGKAVRSRMDMHLLEDGDVLALAKKYEENGADALIFVDLSRGDAEHEKNLGVIREVGRQVGIPLVGGGNINRAEDVKKLLYAGCSQVFLNISKKSNVDMLEEVSKRFGKEKIAVCVNEYESLAGCSDKVLEHASLAILLGDYHLYEAVCNFPLPCLPVLPQMDHTKILALMKADNVVGIAGQCVSSPGFQIYMLKEHLANEGIAVHGNESMVRWDELKLNSDGLIPVVVQEQGSGEVLMVAYMNEEAFEQTIRTGKMHYYSRSRQELWLKGATSGHFQQMISLKIDCDNDTLLATVIQTGAACHTGNHSCFYREVVHGTGVERKNPAQVFDEVYKVILDRKRHPKEGSYTNYLFDKGIDKILKKLGEEATEIVIAAKNPDPEEIKYEAADFLYHLMVLMAQRGVTWDDITEELSKR